MTEQLTFSDGGDSRANQIYARFKKFHKENPKVWALFKRFGVDVTQSGRERYSSDAIFHRIRWHIDIETRSEDGLKLNDHYTAYYGRMFNAVFNVSIFKTRKLTSEDDPGYSEDIAVFDSGPPDLTHEARLTAELKELGKS